MARFGVGARTAAFQLWNHRFISSPEIRDDTIERFAAPRSDT